MRGNQIKLNEKLKGNFFILNGMIFEEAHRKVSATARLLKGDQKNLFLGAKLRKEIRSIINWSS